jgi:diphthamide biosynthesis protein 2
MPSVGPVLSTPTEFHKVPIVKTDQVLSDSQLSNAYWVSELASKLANGDYKSIALQFPDNLLHDSSRVAKLLQTKLSGDQKIFVLADTSYSPCCVDEVAAQHVNAQVVVHFGNACLNAVKSVSVIYVLDGGVSVDLDNAESKFTALYSDKSTHILIVGDTQYSREVLKLHQNIAPHYSNALATSVSVEDASDVTFVPPLIENPTHTECSFLPCRKHPRLQTDLSSYHIFYLGSSNPSDSLILHLSTLVSSVSVLDVSKPDAKVANPQMALQKRYRYMHMARSASTIGILINTLSLRNVNEVLQQVKSWIIRAGKKPYTFVVGKPNVAKLANFDVVDIWVVLGCGIGGIIVDCSDYYKPIITPYELKLALQKDVTWESNWVIDFDSVLQGADLDTTDDQNSDDDRPEFDSITGTYVSSRPLRRARLEIEPDEPSQACGSTNALATRMTTQLAIRGSVSTAAEHLHRRSSWRGLGSDFADHVSNGADLKPGRSGIARGYSVGDSNRT